MLERYRVSGSGVNALESAEIIEAEGERDAVEAFAEAFEAKAGKAPHDGGTVYSRNVEGGPITKWVVAIRSSIKATATIAKEQR